MPSEVFLNIQKLAGQLQYIRDFINWPIKLTNAYRCADHNEKVGGVSDSQHLLGKAADIQVKTLPPKDLYKVVDTLAEYGRVLQGGLGEYNTFVHYDIRKTKARWDNTKK